MSTVVLAEKPSQARDIASAVGTTFGPVLAAQGHLLTLKEPEDVNPAWKTWGCDVLWPGQYFPTRVDPRADKGKKAKIAAIKKALKSADRVIVATDCDREGTLIGGELLKHFKFKGDVLRAVFTAQDVKSIRAAFDDLKPWSAFENEFAAGCARRQADQIFNLSLTRTATVSLRAEGAQGAIGVGRVKTPTLAIVCMREREIANFAAQEYFEVVVTASAAGGSFDMRHAPEERITDRAAAEAIARAASGHEGPLRVDVDAKRRKPPRLLDLPALQKKAGGWGWSAEKTLNVLQALYERWKLVTYPRAEAKYLAESMIGDVPALVAGLTPLPPFATVEMTKPQARRGKAGHFCDPCLAGVSHHAVVPNVNVVETFRAAYPKLNDDERRLFDLIAATYLAALMPDHAYDETTASLNVGDRAFEARGRQVTTVGWHAVLGGDDEDLEPLPSLAAGEHVDLSDGRAEAKRTRPPPRFHEGALVDEMERAWKYVTDSDLRERLKEAKGIGTPATRGEVIKGLKRQGLLVARGKHIVPSGAGMGLFEALEAVAPAIVDPGTTAIWEMALDDVVLGRTSGPQVVSDIVKETGRLVSVVSGHRGKTVVARGGTARAAKGLERASSSTAKGGRPASPKQIEWVDRLCAERNLTPPKGYRENAAVASAFLDEAFAGKKPKASKTRARSRAAGQRKRKRQA